MSTASAELRGARIAPNRVRIDRILAVTIFCFGFGFALQALPPIIAQLPTLRPAIAWPLLAVVFGGLAASVVAAVIGRGTRATASIVAITLLLALLLWPLSVQDAAAVAGQTPWLWYLVTIGTAYAAYSAPLRIAVLYAAITPVMFGALRAMPSGGDAGLTRSLLDAFYVCIVGFVMLLLIVVLRQSADRVDRAQATAMAEYENALRQHAGELERVEVDAVVHDNVLASLLAAASAQSAAERSLAAQMATRALSVLLPEREGVPSEGYVPLEMLVRQLQHASATFGAELDVRGAPTSAADAALSRPVAEALLGAAWQALTNSVQHAGPDPSVTRRVRAVLDEGAIDISIEDDGRGFVLEDVPRERLGIRLSILERVRAAGGSALVLSTPGRGTQVRLGWSADSEPAAQVRR
ncbi:ATP-binding protein [Microbacteriaceae bacterium VKM Ac-2855]|nr:ATP-binding protein [Microbacteriaceae bacterium VKM Ac-2855]